MKNDPDVADIFDAVAQLQNIGISLGDEVGMEIPNIEEPHIDNSIDAYLLKLDFGEKKGSSNSGGIGVGSKEFDFSARSDSLIDVEGTMNDLNSFLDNFNKKINSEEGFGNSQPANSRNRTYSVLETENQMNSLELKWDELDTDPVDDFDWGDF